MRPCRIIYLLLLHVVFSRCSRPETASIDTPGVFTLQPADSIGIRFTNHLIENDVVNYFNTKYIYNGGGVAAGDINNDGLPDLYFSSNIFSNALYLNKGDLKFEDISKTAGVEASRGFKTGVAMADLNADGWLDIFVCRSNHPTGAIRSNLVYLNNRDLTFTESAATMGLQDSSYTTHVAFLDYDRDGDVDIYAVNHPHDFESGIQVRVKPTDKGFLRRTEPDNPLNSDRLYRNNGDGTFSDVSKKAGIWNHAFGLSATVTDINKDGWPDVYVANDFIEPDFLYINNGDGTFRDAFGEYFRHTAHNSMGSDFADFDNDGHEDAIVVDMLPEDNFRQKISSTSMVLDRYETLLKYGYKHQLMRNVLQRNNGNGTFSDIAPLAGVSNTDWSWAPLFADFDNDGWKDLFISNGIRKDITNLDYIQFKQDSINKADNLGVPYVSRENFKKWVNQMPSTKLRNYLYRNNGDLTFTNHAEQWGLNHKTFSNGSTLADLDADGDLEIIINNIDTVAFVYRNNSRELGGNNFLRVRLTGPASNPLGIGTSVKVYADGKVQTSEQKITRGYLSTVEPVLHFGIGKAKTADSVIVEWPDGKSFTVPSPIAVNTTIDIGYTSAKKRSKPVAKQTETMFTKMNDALGLTFVHRENDYNDFKREFLLPRAFSRQGPAMCKGDINGDGMEDVFIGGAMGQPGVTYLQQKGNRFVELNQPVLLSDRDHEDTDAVLFDADQDGDQDLYVVSGGSEKENGETHYEDRLYINDGTGRFSRNRDALPPKTTNASVVTTSDFDKDGDLDLFIGGGVLPGRYPESSRSYLLLNEKGKFTDVTASIGQNLLNAGIINAAEWADINNDGYDDLILAGDWMPVSLFINRQGKSFDDATSRYGLHKMTGWWTSLAVADINNDKRPDIIAGNWGLNSMLKANESEPLSIYSADFDQNGSLDPVICHYVQGKKWPLPRREILISQIPSLRKKFVGFTSYASATIENIFPAEKLSKASYKEANNLASGTFIQGSGEQYQWKALPNAAQTAPLYAILAGDFDNDNNADLLIAGNDYHPQVEEGVCDSGNGLVLRFVNNQWQVIPPTESGYFSGRENRRIISVKLQDGTEALVTANNNSSAEVFVIKSNGKKAGTQLLAARKNQ